MKSVVLVNYGGPENTLQVRDYLYRLLSDKNIIQLPHRYLRKAMARMISRARAKKISANYSAIGGSPLLSHTESLVRKLNATGRHRYHAAMAFSPPFIADVLRSLPGRDVFVFPLFPQFSLTTTGACLRQAENSGKRFFYLKEYWQDPAFNALIVKRIKGHVQENGKTAVLLSAHALPLRYARRGDPYLASIHSHFQKLQDLLPELSLHLGFQSRFGPRFLKWSGPELMAVLQELKGKGISRLVLYPLSFVIDNYETAYEIDIFYRNKINQFGFAFRRPACLNDSDDFVSYIGNKVNDNPWFASA